jgi:hypothetical protein
MIWIGGSCLLLFLAARWLFARQWPPYTKRKDW